MVSKTPKSYFPAAILAMRSLFSSLREKSFDGLVKEKSSSIDASSFNKSLKGERHIAVRDAFGKASLNSVKMGVAMTRSPIQLGMRTIMFCGSLMEASIANILIAPQKRFA